MKRQNYFNRLTALAVLLIAVAANGFAQKPKVRTVPIDSIIMSDPCILADKATKTYYMTGTGGMLWKSPDLKSWTGPYKVAFTDDASWMGKNPMIWAAELHKYNGKYYYFATFTNRNKIIGNYKGNDIERRSSHVLVSDKAEGPYRPFGDAEYLPANRPTLDGTFWVDRDNKPYMIYCGEWLANWNGTIEKIQLKPDLSGTIGEGKVLFRSSDSPWSKEMRDGKEVPNKVTDGPWLFRTATGKLGMLWTSWVFGLYTQGVAYSESGTLDGPWVQEKEPITPPNFGHAMLFQTFDGRWLMSVHSHSNVNGRTIRRPHLFAVDLSGDKIKVIRDVKIHVNTDKEPHINGKYEGTMESLSDYKAPEWYTNAKFGIWAHWGPQCQPEYGDWFARGMYEEGSDSYRYSKLMRGPQSEFGFKDWINEWKAENWNPERLIKLYKESGAKYFMALANHHDNLDLWQSKYQPWNSVNMGPKKDILQGWADACKKYDMPFCVSVHAAHAWTWYETSRGADKKGLLAGKTYDGCLTKADGKGKWWEGYDPQDLYCQNHKLSPNNGEWDWNEWKVTLPDQEYCDKFYNRTMDLINRYNPRMIYFDDTTLPLFPFSDAGMQITANFYNKSMAENGGKNQAVVTGKILTDEQKKSIVWDVERGACEDIQKLPWQTCTCIGSWHYDKRIYYDKRYKSAQTVVQILADVVAKNGNLLLSVPVKGDGTIDTVEENIVRQIGAWLNQNGEAIYGTRPFTTFGEGPAMTQKNALSAQGFNEGKTKYTYEDVRYTRKGNAIYIITMQAPEGNLTLKQLGRHKLGKKIKKLTVLGTSEKIQWQQTADCLKVNLPSQLGNKMSAVVKVTL